MLLRESDCGGFVGRYFEGGKMEECEGQGTKRNEYIKQPPPPRISFPFFRLYHKHIMAAGWGLGGGQTFLAALHDLEREELVVHLVAHGY